jgi:hypothetical protein
MDTVVGMGKDTVVGMGMDTVVDMSIEVNGVSMEVDTVATATGKPRR